MKVGLVAPVFDEVTPYSYDWAKQVLAKLVEEGHQVVELSGSPIARGEVELKMKDVEMFIFYDHGSENALWGSQYEPVMDLDNYKVFQAKEVYTMACLSAKKLGVEIWREDKVFWGFYEVFSFTTDAMDEFKAFANYGILRRLEGKTWKECLELTRAYGYELARKLSEAGKYVASMLMNSNTNVLRCYNGEVPKTGCFFRAIAKKLFGRKGWFISKTRGLAMALFFTGFGISLHDFVHALWEAGGYEAILSAQGGYFGFTLMILAFLIELRDFLKSLK